MLRHGQKSEPTPEQIKQRAEKIRETWTKARWEKLTEEAPRWKVPEIKLDRDGRRGTQ